MTSTIDHSAQAIVILGTGGTIAGASSVAGDNVGYTAAQRSVADLLAAVPALAGAPVEAARLLGFGPLYIVRRHLLPELLPALRRGGMAAVSPVGVLGDATTASALEGSRIFAEMVGSCVRRISTWRPGPGGMLA